MHRKHRIITSVVVGALVGGLVAALSWPGPDYSPQCNYCRETKQSLSRIYRRLLGYRECGSSKHFCIANLKQIDGAKATWALEHKKENSDVPTTNDLFGASAYILDPPMCPHNGIYSIRTVAEKPTCSHPGHTL